MVTMAYAYLTPTSLFAQNDGFLVRDSETGLDWLKLSETAGLSVNGVLGNSGGWIGRGFRYATTNEVVDQKWQATDRVGGFYPGEMFQEP
jgi:hypothetical protein